MIALARRVVALGGTGRLGLAALAGAASALAQPPVSWPLVLFLALPALLWCLDGARGPWEAFRIGWMAGAAQFAAALFWIVEPFLVEPEVYGWMAPFALVGMAGGLALFWAVPFAAARAWWTPGPGRVLLLAALWTLADYARGHVLTGFPWGLFGYAWVETPVMQVAALTGPHGLGFLTLVAGLLPGLLSWPAVAAAGVLVALGWGFGGWRLAQPVPERAEPVVVRLVQPNADQALKWQPGMEQVFYDRHIALTRAPADRRPDVVIWSETAVPFVLGQAPDLLAESAAAAGPAGRLVLGIRRVEGEPGAERWYNALAVLGPDGTAAATYDKHHLVPFGEYVPLGGAIARLGLPALEPLTRAGFSAGDGPHLVAAEGLPPFLPLICYEAIFPGALQAPEGRAEWLVQVTNDAWFGTASGPYQHFAQARVRAIEQGLPAGASRQYRDLGHGRSLRARSREPRSWRSGLCRCRSSGSFDAHSLRPFRRPAHFDWNRRSFGINFSQICKWSFSKVASITCRTRGPASEVTRDAAMAAAGSPMCLFELGRVSPVSMSASQIDAHVGLRMRKRREALGISQGRLGRHLGLTFSQIQKYEKGTNRIGAGRLYQISAYLGVTPGHFFEGIDGGTEPVARPAANGGAYRDEFLALSEAFSSINNPQTRASVLALVRSLAMAPRQVG